MIHQLRTTEINLDDLLNRFAEELQLDSTRWARMESAYIAVSDWIKDDDVFFNSIDFEIYPHGSVSTGTTVKPTGRNEFDLDFVIHIILEWEKYNPTFILEQLKRRLSENETYKKMLLPKNRVVRLNYSGDFHMDIMPGCQESGNNKLIIRVPDREKSSWISSSPRGISAWFNAKADTVTEFLLEKAYAQAELPKEEAYALKKPLKRAIQIMKWQRDRFFENDPENKTSSIILNTLVGEFYKGEGTIYQTIENTLQVIHDNMATGNSNFRVLNPVNPKEDFTEKWDNNPMLRTRFVDFVKDFKIRWSKLKSSAGVDENKSLLKGMFGEALTDRLISEQHDYFKKEFVPIGAASKRTHEPKNINSLKKIASRSKPYCQ